MSESDFTSALREEYDYVMVSLGMSCRKSDGDLTAPDVTILLAKADALDVVCKLWGVNPSMSKSKSKEKANPQSIATDIETEAELDNQIV